MSSALICVGGSCLLCWTWLMKRSRRSSNSTETAFAISNHPYQPPPRKFDQGRRISRPNGIQHLLGEIRPQAPTLNQQYYQVGEKRNRQSQTRGGDPQAMIIGNQPSRLRTLAIGVDEGTVGVL